MLALLLGERSASRTREELKMPIRGGQRVLQVVAEASDQPSAALGHAAQLLPLPLRLRAGPPLPKDDLLSLLHGPPEIPGAEPIAACQADDLECRQHGD